MAAQLDLRQALEVIFNHLEKNQFIKGVSNDEKNSILDELTQALEQNCELSPDDLKSKSVQKALSVALVNAFVMKTLDPKADLAKELSPLFNVMLAFKDKKINDPELNDLLKLVIKDTLKLINKLDPNAKKLDDKELDDMAEKLVNKLTEKLDQEKPALDDDATLEKSPTASKFFEELMSATLRNLYGGMDPRFAGGMIAPIQSNVGNLMGAIDIGGGTSEYSTIDDNSRVDTTRPDYTGSEDITKENKISSGAMNEGLEQELEHEGLLNSGPSNWPPRPAGPGGH